MTDSIDLPHGYGFSDPTIELYVPMSKFAAVVNPELSGVGGGVKFLLDEDHQEVREYGIFSKRKEGPKASPEKFLNIGLKW